MFAPSETRDTPVNYNCKSFIELTLVVILFFQEANSRLRRELGQHDEISRLMVSSKDLDNVTHSELVQKFGKITFLEQLLGAHDVARVRGGLRARVG